MKIFIILLLLSLSIISCSKKPMERSLPDKTNGKNGFLKSYKRAL